MMGRLAEKHELENVVESLDKTCIRIVIKVKGQKLRIATSFRHLIALGLD